MRRWEELRGEFDKRGRPPVIEGRTSCARCHDNTSFRTLEKFDHGAWTGFPLDPRSSVKKAWVRGKKVYDTETDKRRF